MTDVTKNTMHDKDEHDKSGQDKNSLLAQTIAGTLDKSVDQLDDITLQKLKRARENALKQTPKASRKWGSLSVAASIAILLIAPVVWQQHQSATFAEQDFDVIAQDIPIDSQEMDDIEMLMAMEDTDA